MKQGGTFLAIILAISGVLHYTGSGGSSQNSSDDSGSTKKKSHSPSTYEADLRSAIQQFYGVWDPPAAKAEALKSSWNVPDSEELTGNVQTVSPHPRSDVHFAIAILPDPLHTRLALVFDRGIEAIQEGAERKGYTFDRAVFPWDRSQPPQSDDIDKRQAAADARKSAEEYPGLLIFRGPTQGGNPTEYPPPLFVFIVGETPTSGIRKKQFQNAVRIMKEIRAGNASEPKGSDAPAKERPLLILGPTSSGSLRSLRRELEIVKADKDSVAQGDTFIYSGTITDFTSIKEFRDSTDKTTFFATFQENDDFIRDRFLKFVCYDGFHSDEIATLSEGETAYGNAVQGPIKASTGDNKSADAGSNIAGKTGQGAATATSNSAAQPSQATPASGADASGKPAKTSKVAPKAPCDPTAVVHLRFPREISYFRAAYQEKAASLKKFDEDIPVPQSTNVTLSPEEIGTDDDAALPYAGAQTPANQEAVMLGIISELNKHHTKFTIVYATDPLDQYFLARYLRTKYPRGRVVVTTPDLLLTTQGDSTLRGVIGISTYPIVPGLSDTFCTAADERDHHHDDRLFVSSLSIGTLNAMIGLLTESGIADTHWEKELAAKVSGQLDPGRVIPLPVPPEITKTAPIPSGNNAAVTADGGSGTSHAPLGNQATWNGDEHTSEAGWVPPALYSEYTTPGLLPIDDHNACIGRPLVWLTMLGQDGFWPITGLSDRDIQTDNGYEQILHFDSGAGGSTEPFISSTQGIPFDLHKPAKDAGKLFLPPAWRISYCLGFFLLVMHMTLSISGSVLADSELRAQFARIEDWRDVVVIALGAVALETGIVTILFSGGPALTGIFDQLVLWLPFPIFMAVTIYDLGWLRKQKWIAFVFALGTIGMFVFEYITWLDTRSAYWSTRVLHFASGVSPVLPILFLAGAGYWWMWQSLRGVTLVDRRRPRLPARNDPAGRWYRINEHEAGELRDTAHPFVFKLPVTIAVCTAFFFLFPLLDFTHPVQTIEGQTYDRTYFALLSLMIATLLGCLLKLVFTWLKCNQILSGLDRLPLRDAFSRMTHLSWHSLWNPGGSTLRATYKILRRGLDSLERLRCSLPAKDPKAPVTPAVRADIETKITSTMHALEKVFRAYVDVVDPDSATKAAAALGPDSTPEATSALDPVAMRQAAALANDSATGEREQPSKHGDEGLRASFNAARRRHEREVEGLPALMEAFQKLQENMADTAADIVDKMLDPWWKCDKAPVVSEDDRFKEEKLPLTRMLAEEFVALVYVNFLITVLLRMRTLVVTAIGMFVFIVLSMNVYPFEPHPALQTLAVTLLVLMGAAVGFVYAQMHRDPILSRLTSTTSGELGWDFWLKLASAGAIPVFSLLAVQFPEINRFLFSWLEPALQAVK